MNLRLTPLCAFLLCLAVVTGQRDRFHNRQPAIRQPPPPRTPPSTGTRPVRPSRPSRPTSGGSPPPSSSTDIRVSKSEQAILQRRQEAERVPLRSAGGISGPRPLQIQQAGSVNRQQSAGQGSGAYFGPGNSIVVDGITYFPINGRYNIRGYWYIICSDFAIPDSAYICCSGVYYPLKDGIECCGTNYYIPGPEICCDNSRWYDAIDPDSGRTAVCCGETYYVPDFEICCGGYYYDKSRYGCCGGSPFRVSDQCCDGTVVRPTGFCGCRETASRVCCNETPYNRLSGYGCCGSRYLPTSSYLCCGNRPYPTKFGYQCCRGVNEYIPAQDECCSDGRVVARPATCAGSDPCTPGGGGHVYYRK